MKRIVTASRRARRKQSALKATIVEARAPRPRHYGVILDDDETEAAEPVTDEALGCPLSAVYPGGAGQAEASQGEAAQVSELPTPRDLAKNDFRLVVWCRSCRNQQELRCAELVERGYGDRPVVNRKFRCSRCSSRLTDKVVSGGHFRPAGRYSG